jgi:hypothetical protein
MATVVFGAAFLARELTEKKKGTGRRFAAAPWGKGKELGFDTEKEGRDLWRGKGGGGLTRLAWSLQRGKEHASYVLHWEEGVNKTKQKKQKLRVGLDWTCSVWPEKGRRVFQIC